MAADRRGCYQQSDSPVKGWGQVPELGHYGCRLNPDAGGHHKEQRWPHLEQKEITGQHICQDPNHLHTVAGYDEYDGPAPLQVNTS